MCKVIAISNQKGGVTKTTSTFNIAVALTLRGKRVLQVDLDAQSNLTISSGYNPTEFDKTIVNVFDNDMEIVNAIYGVEDIWNLSLLPAHPYLAGTELKLMNQMSRERKLLKALKHVKELFDFILIDCPPQLSLTTINGLVASDFVLVPCECSQLSFYALQPLMDTITGIKEELNEGIEIIGVIATLYDSRTLIDKYVLEELEKSYEVLGIIKRTVAAKRGLQKGLPVVITEPNSEIAVEYKKIADKIIEKVGV